MTLKPHDPKKFSIEDAAHLARRAMFGATGREVRALHALGLHGMVDRLLQFEPRELPDNPFTPVDAVNGGGVRVTEARWLHEMIHTPHPLREKLALMWSGHFVIGTDKIRNVPALAQYLSVLRTHALGRFETLTLEVSRSPAMLRYLDNDRNVRGRPNENFSRELLELFTTGIGHYTEQDVLEGARALTGWTVRSSAPMGATRRDLEQAEAQFVFVPRRHDPGEKTYLGQWGNFTGEDAVRIACAHPATSAFVSGRLWRAFVSDTPDPAGVRSLAVVFRETQGDLHAVLRALLLSEAFFAPANRRAIIKSPVEFVVGTLRTAGQPRLDDRTTLQLTQNMARMGQQLLRPPTVKGWDGGREWINDTTLLLRMQTAAQLVMGKAAKLRDVSPPEPLALLGTERSPLEDALHGLTPAQQTYLTLISPEYALA